MNLKRRISSMLGKPYLYKTFPIILDHFVEQEDQILLYTTKGKTISLSLEKVSRELNQFLPVLSTKSREHSEGMERKPKAVIVKEEEQKKTAKRSYVRKAKPLAGKDSRPKLKSLERILVEIIKNKAADPLYLPEAESLLEQLQRIVDSSRRTLESRMQAA